MRYLRPYWLLSVGMFLSLLVSTGSMLVIPRLSQYAIDDGIVRGDLRRVVWLGLAMVGMAALRALFQFAQGALAARVAHGIAFDMRNELYGRIQSLSFSYHDRSQTGQLLTRATSDVEAVQRFVGRGLVMFLSALLMMFGSLVLLFGINARLASLMLIVIPVTLAFFGVFARLAMPLFKESQQRLADLNTILQENFAGVRIVKAFVREAYEAARYEAGNQRFYEINIDINKIVSLAFPTIFGVLNVTTLGIYWLGGYQVIGGALSIGELVAFGSYVMSAFFPVLMMGMIIAMLSSAAASATRVFEILDAESEVVESPDARDIGDVSGRVVFEDVTFRYYEGGEAVLNHVSFAIEPGQTVALLGATGSGKSTVINLIPRFYDVDEGRVTIDGHDVRDVTLESLRAKIGIVLQETTLFEGTIRDNVAFGRPNAEIDQVIEASKAAEAHDFIMAFPDGYESHVGERGVNLSGGQKQRIAIARAILLDPQVLILDDATSSVDLATEYRIQRALERLMHGRTSFVIAQRVATARNADAIIVLEQGEVTAQGTHMQLLETSEIYVDIYSSQLEEEHDRPAATGSEPAQEVTP